MDVGNYEIKKSARGKLAAQREPIYKYIPPGQQPKDIVKERLRNRVRVKLPPSKKRTLATNAQERFSDDPFTEKSRSRRINLIY